ncbi:MAG: RNA polymerase sigma factor SigA [Nitrospira sp.]|nr:RNA polymerase sigma factor SigA [Nitrospira sp.]
MPLLELYEEYSREEAHDILSPQSSFAPQVGTWGLQGVVPIGGREGDYAFFVTFGRRQGAHVFDEGITAKGRFRWQSQPSQGLRDKRVLQWIAHDPAEQSIYLFLRADDNRKYAYLGRLEYVTHDPERERPVYFTWQILSWALSEERRRQLNLSYVPDTADTDSRIPPENGGLVTPVGASPQLMERLAGRISLAALTQHFNLSTRLENGMRRAFEGGVVSTETVADYLIAPKIEEKLLRSWGLGRKSIKEFDSLVRRVSAAGKKATDVSELAQFLRLSPASVARLVDNISVDCAEAGEQETARDLKSAETRESSIAQVRGLIRKVLFPKCLERLPTSVRLTNALAVIAKEYGSAVPLDEVVTNISQWADRLRKQPNVGRTTVAEFRQILCGLIIDVLAETDEFRERAEEIGRLLCDLDAGLRPVQLPKLSDEKTGFTTRELLSQLLGRLSERKREVLERRFGLKGDAETLQEIGVSFKVTRERVRQIEKKALRELGRQADKEMLAALMQEAGSIWDGIAGPDRAISRLNLPNIQQKAPPTLILALAIANQSLEKFLNRCARKCGNGWVSRGASIERLSEIRNRFKLAAKKTLLPHPLEGLVTQEELFDARASAIVFGYRLYGSYLVAGRASARVRRAVNLHVFLKGQPELLQLAELVERYRVRFLDDACSTRDAAIVLETNRHLFVEILEGVWKALGPVGSLPDILGRDTPIAADDEAEPASQDEDEPQTIAASVEAALRMSGPLRISEIIEGAREYLGPEKSINSVGPVLLSTKDRFVRPLPGIYALKDQIPRREDLIRLRPKFLFQEEQLRIYAFARQAGEPWGSYPLWLPETEYLWCVWARQHAVPELLESLLSIVDVGAWPEVEGRHEWADFARSRGKFSMEFVPRFDAVALPTLDQLLAGCLFVQSFGRMSWVSANRILQRRALENVGAGLLACLIRLRVLQPEAHWQANHQAGPDVDAVTTVLVEARRTGTQLLWTTALGQDLLTRLRSQAMSGWLETTALPDIFEEGDHPRRVADTRTALERLLDEREQSNRSSAMDSLATTLVGSQAGGSRGRQRE